MSDPRESLIASPRRVGAAGLVALAPAFVATFGWGAHWNAYTNLALTLGDLVLWATLYVSLRPTNVVLTAFTPPSGQKIKAIREIRAATNLGLKEAKDATEGRRLKMDRGVARTLAPKLRDLGLDVEIRRG